MAVEEVLRVATLLPPSGSMCVGVLLLLSPVGYYHRQWRLFPPAWRLYYPLVYGCSFSIQPASFVSVLVKQGW